MRKNYFKTLFLLIFSSPFLFAGSNSLTLENDAIVGKDNHYTNGIYYVWMSENGVDFPDMLPFLDLEQKNVAFSLSHAIFTPKDKKTKEVILDDLPYAGYMDLNFLFYKSSSNIFNELGVNIGMVGPSTRAEDLQKWFHTVIGHSKPRGWDNQLKDHFLSGISYNVGYKTTPFRLKGTNVDVTLNLRGDYGNFYTGFLTGATVRFSSIPLESFSVTGNFIGANESLLLNYKEIKNFNWAFSLGVYYNKFYRYYLIDEAIDEGYHLKEMDYLYGAKLSLDIFYDDYKISFYLKSVDIFWEDTPSFTNESTGGINVTWKF